MAAAPAAPAAAGCVCQLVFACQIACKFMLRFSIFFSHFHLFYLLYICGHKIFSNYALPSVKNANITEIYVIIQSACGIFCYCIFLLLVFALFRFCFFVCFLHKICVCCGGRFYCARSEYFIDVSQVLDGFLIASTSISKLFATQRTLIKLTSSSRIVWQ